MESTEQFNALLQAAKLVHSRYQWPQKFSFEDFCGLKDLECVDDEEYRQDVVRQLNEDHGKLVAIRRTISGGNRIQANPISPDFENLALFVNAARSIASRYEWGEEQFHFMGELEGEVDRIVSLLKEDFEHAYDLHKALKRGKRSDLRVPNQIADLISSLMFQAIRSVEPFSVKRESDQGRYNRVARVVENLLYQMCILVDAEYTKKVW